MPVLQGCPLLPISLLNDDAQRQWGEWKKESAQTEAVERCEICINYDQSNAQELQQKDWLQELVDSFNDKAKEFFERKNPGEKPCKKTKVMMISIQGDLYLNITIENN